MADEGDNADGRAMAEKGDDSDKGNAGWMREGCDRFDGLGHFESDLGWLRPFRSDMADASGHPISIPHLSFVWGGMPVNPYI